MEFNTRYGMNVTKRCNWKCKHCFYIYNEDFNTKWDLTLDEAKAIADREKSKGVNDIVIIGYGEPALWKPLNDFVKYCRSVNIGISIITNGSLKLDIYKELYDSGLDHLHISVHDYGFEMNGLVGNVKAADSQFRLLTWLRDNRKPFRTNTTVTKHNYMYLHLIADFIQQFNPYHIVLLNFLPHFGHREKSAELEVSFNRLKPHIEYALECIDCYKTVRYMPLCYIDRKYWKYVTNTIHVPFDFGEWYYGDCPTCEQDAIKTATRLNEAVVKDDCRKCGLFNQCGGMNKYLHSELKPAAWESGDPFYWFSQNPFNQKFRGKI